MKKLMLTLSVNVILLTAWTTVYGMSTNLKRKLLQSNTEELRKRTITAQTTKSTLSPKNTELLIQLREFIRAIKKFDLSQIMNPFVEECKNVAREAKKTHATKTDWTLEDIDPLLKKAHLIFNQKHPNKFDELFATATAGEKKVKEGKKLIERLERNESAEDTRYEKIKENKEFIGYKTIIESKTKAFDDFPSALQQEILQILLPEKAARLEKLQQLVHDLEDFTLQKLIDEFSHKAVTQLFTIPYHLDAQITENLINAIVNPICEEYESQHYNPIKEKLTLVKKLRKELTLNLSRAQKESIDKTIDDTGQQLATKTRDLLYSITRGKYG